MYRLIKRLNRDFPNFGKPSLKLTGAIQQFSEPKKPSSFEDRTT